MLEVNSILVGYTQFREGNKINPTVSGKDLTSSVLIKETDLTILDSFDHLLSPCETLFGLKFLISSKSLILFSSSSSPCSLNSVFKTCSGSC